MTKQKKHEHVPQKSVHADDEASLVPQTNKLIVEALGCLVGRKVRHHFIHGEYPSFLDLVVRSLLHLLEEHVNLRVVELHAVPNLHHQTSRFNRYTVTAYYR